jgi:hypothetical protein
MKLHGSIKINGKAYPKGTEIPWYRIYPFFLLHMFMFGGSGFVMAYAGGGAPTLFLFLHGGLAILVYTVFYITIFGRDEVKWMFINAGLGLFGIYTQIDWLLSLFGKQAGDYPIYKHVIPFLYFVLYTFLLRQAVLDLADAREEGTRKARVEYGYVAVSLIIYAVSAWT